MRSSDSIHYDLPKIEFGGAFTRSKQTSEGADKPQGRGSAVHIRIRIRTSEGVKQYTIGVIHAFVLLAS